LTKDFQEIALNIETSFVENCVGALRTIRFGPLEIEAAEKDVADAREIVRAISAPDSEKLPFETEQLANYYAQVLGQSKVSFWFSLCLHLSGF
jgi:hypothetical protein